jgi:DNA-binding transcriptional LysR family regulator
VRAAAANPGGKYNREVPAVISRPDRSTGPAHAAAAARHGANLALTIQSDRARTGLQSRRDRSAKNINAHQISRREKMRHSPRRFSVKLGDGDLRRLHVFCAVTRCGGFAAAESELQMGLPSISRIIKDLEIRLGVRLCQRGRVGFELTDEGRHVYAASLQLTADLKRFETNMSSIHSALAGTLTLGLIDTLITDSNLPLPQLIKEYKRRHAHVEFDIQTKATNTIEQSVIDGTLDAGLVVGRRRINQLDYRPLYRERLSLYCSEDHPLFHEDVSSISLEEVSKYDYAGYSSLEDSHQSESTRLLAKRACADSVEALATLVSSGCFIALLPDHYVKSVWRLKNFKAILPDLISISTDIELVTRHGTFSPLVLTLLDIMDDLQTPLPAGNTVTTLLNRIGRNPVEVELGAHVA